MLLDVIVAGAGPAGNQTALKLAQAGHSVAVVDYRTDLGDKLCTGIVGRDCFQRYGPEPDLVLHESRSARLITSPDRQIALTRAEPQAYVVDRASFVSRIADRAVKAGASYITNALITSIDVRADGVDVAMRRNGHLSTISGRALVVASGAGSRLACMAGLEPARDMALASQIRVEAPDTDETSVLLPSVLPSGHFGWLVPQGDGSALLGVLGRRSMVNGRNAAMNAIRQAGIAGAALGEWKHWPVPVAPAPKTFGNRVLLAGDVAGQVKPTTGGGIYYSLLAADLASETLDEALRQDDLTERSLRRYESAWKSLLGRELRVGRFARSIFERLDGRSLERILGAAHANGMLDEEVSFDWHSKLIVKAISNQVMDAALRPVRAVSGMLYAII